MKGIRFIVILIVWAPCCAFSQSDAVGSGRAIKFDGVDDYIDLGNIYDDIALPITISAWVFVEPSSNVIQYPIFHSQDNSGIYNGFTFVCSTLPHIGFSVGDGKGGNNPLYRRSRAGYFTTLGQWIHITTVAKSEREMYTFLNGHDVSGDYQGSSEFPMNSNSPDEVAKIGKYFANDIHYWFKGVMDELRIWNRTLSVTEIRETMCKRLRGNEAGLIGYWNFDETAGSVLKAITPNALDGALMGNPTRVFSGAPVGNQSVYHYTDDWAGKTMMLDNVFATNVSGNPFGIHIYRVDHAPSQTGGLNQEDLHAPYYGVFLADDALDTFFDVSLGANMQCQLFEREDNAEAEWHPAIFSGIQGRVEIISSYEGTLDVNLGNDISVCDTDLVVLEAGDETTGKTFSWSSGQTTPVITVHSSGEFAVEVKTSCEVGRDTINVSFAAKPPEFSLGHDEISCSLENRTLSIQGGDEYDFTWQDGSKGKSFTVTDFGTYWLKIENACGVAMDSVTFAGKSVDDVKLYNFMSPGNTDDLNQYFTLDERLIGAQLMVFNRWGNRVYLSLNYRNDWNAGDLPNGVYYYAIIGECFQAYKGTLTIMRH